jgi:flagellar assembly factor FliW
MVVSTKDLGNVEISEENIIMFPHGLYGFKDFHRFVLLSGKKRDSLFLWLQCVDSREPRFVVIDPLKIIKNYNIPAGAVKSAVTPGDEKNLRILAITTVTSGAKEIYVNLKCPIVINACDNTATQVILDNDDYPLRYYILKREG